MVTKHKASESIHVHDVEGKSQKFCGVLPSEKSEDGEKQIAVPMERSEDEKIRVG